MATDLLLQAVVVYHRAQAKTSPTPKDRRGACRDSTRSNEKVRSRFGAGVDQIGRGDGRLGRSDHLGIGANLGCSMSTGLSPPMFGAQVSLSVRDLGGGEMKKVTNN